MVILIGIMLFGLFFHFLLENANDAGVTVEPKYNSTFNNLTGIQDDIDGLGVNIRDQLIKIKEADNNVQAAFFGLIGMLAIFKLPIDLFDLGLRATEQTFMFLDIPGAGIVKSIVLVMVVIMISFALMRFIAQRGNDA
jgi:hypothetical protein